MKYQNNVLIATLVALAFAVAPVVQAGPHPDGGPTRFSAAAPSPDGGPISIRTTPNPRARPNAVPRPDNAANEGISADGEASPANPDDVQMPVITVHSTGDVSRGKTGAFVLEMKPALLLGGLYVNFSVSGTAAEGVDYVALVSPAYIGKSGYAVIQVQTLPDPRDSSIRKAYSVVITLTDGAGYALGKPSSATMWIKP